MELNKVIFLLFETIIMSEAIFIGAVFIILNRKKEYSSFLLGFLLLFLGISFFISLIGFINLGKGDVNYESSFFCWLLPILLYTYINVGLIEIKKKVFFLFLSLGIIGTLLSFVIYFSPFEIKQYIKKSVFYLFYEIIGFLFSFMIFSLIYIEIRKKLSVLTNKPFDFLWINRLILFLIISLFFIGFSMLFLVDYYIILLMLCFKFLTITYISYNGLQKQLLPIDSIEEDLVKKDKNASSNCENDIKKYTSILIKIDALIKEEYLFLDPGLTIVNISEKINEHPRLVSKVINTINEENFNSYINRFRVDFAKKMLKDKANENLNIEGIGNKSGFKSNSSFYTAFNKHLNTTPSKYIKENRL